MKTISTGPREELDRQKDTKGLVGWMQEAHTVRGWIVLRSQWAGKKFWTEKI